MTPNRDIPNVGKIYHLLNLAIAKFSILKIVFIKNSQHEHSFIFKIDFFSALSLVMVCIMMRGVWPLLIESALILLQTVPTHIDVDVLKKKLLENIDGILAVHDFHVWQLTGDKIIASAHIRCLNLSEYMKVSKVWPLSHPKNRFFTQQ